jgi:hypothetical protein
LMKRGCIASRPFSIHWWHFVLCGELQHIFLYSDMLYYTRMLSYYIGISWK